MVSVWSREQNTESALLADRNVLADQARGSFGQFQDNMLQKIKPGTDKAPTNGSIFFGIFQALMTGSPGLYKQYPKDFFDLVIVDECHRGGAREGSNWQGILNYFDAVKLGLTATPRRDDNADSYEYFGDPVYEYSRSKESRMVSYLHLRLIYFRTSWMAILIQGMMRCLWGSLR